VHSSGRRLDNSRAFCRPGSENLLDKFGARKCLYDLPPFLAGTFAIPGGNEYVNVADSEPAVWVFRVPATSRRNRRTKCEACSAKSRRIRPVDFSKNAMPLAIAAAFLSPKPASPASEPSSITAFSPAILVTFNCS